MKILDLQNAVAADWQLQHFSILPEDSTVLLNATVDNIPKINTKYIFLDYSFDPVRLTDSEIQELITRVNQKCPKSKCIFLSGNCQHYHKQIDNVLWYPYFFFRKFSDPPPTIRNKRIGCLNRRNAHHRVWLMYNLLSKGLIDHSRDIFSVAFANIHTQKRCDIRDWLPATDELQKLLNQYPEYIATVNDVFPNDHSIAHPAWATALTIVTETEVDDLAMITEKTIKAIEAECCWITYTGQSALNVITDLGFQLDMFESHAVSRNIDPIVTACQTLDTESIALDYYYSKKHLIDHNSLWLKHGWQDRYLKKLNTILT